MDSEERKKAKEAVKSILKYIEHLEQENENITRELVSRNDDYLNAITENKKLNIQIIDLLQKRDANYDN